MSCPAQTTCPATGRRCLPGPALPCPALHGSGRPAITMWSSGTGFAGVFGYAWVAVLHLLGEGGLLVQVPALH